MQLAANTVVFLLGPDFARTHPVEHLDRRFNRAREHEPYGLEKGDRAGFEVAVFAPDSGLAYVAGDEVHPLDVGDGNPERLRDRGLHEPLAEPDPHLT